MAINFPNLKQILERSRSDVRAVLPTLDPSKPKSFLRAIVDSNSGRAFDAVTLLKQVLNQLFPQTAVDEYLTRWGEYNNLELRAAQPTSGYAVVNGTVGVSVPAGTLYNSVTGNQYEIVTTGVVGSETQSLLTASADANKVITCTVTNPHPFATGCKATFTGLTNSADTADAEITVLSDTSFSFVSPTVTTTGSVLGTGQYSFAGVTLEVESVETGADKDLGSGSVLSIVTPILNLDPEAFIDFDGLRGGTDIESPESYRARILERRANPVANFNEAAIEQQAKKVAAVTKVYIAPITPYPGAVSIYFFVQSGTSMTGIPSPSQVTDVRNSILEIKPVTTDEDDVIVEAPNVVSIAHTIISLSPNTSTMQAAIAANLEAFYEDEAELGLDITVDMIKNVIQNTQDTVTGEFPAVFTLTAPAATTTIDNDEVAGYGGVTFA